MGRTLTTLAPGVLVAALLCSLASEAAAQRGGMRGGGGSVRYGSAAVRGGNSRNTYNRHNPGTATRANAGSLRQGRSPGDRRSDRDRYRYPLETDAEAPSPARGRAGAAVAGSGAAPANAGPSLPPVGAALAALPAGNRKLRVRGKGYYYHLGLFYRPRFSYGSVEYIRVVAPEGAILEELPGESRVISVKGIEYRTFGGSWYKPIRRRNRQNWIVVKPPIKTDDG